MRSMAKPFIIFVERFYPDPFVFAIALTFVVFLMAVGMTDAGPVAALSAWGGGLSLLLEFIAQIAITLITAHALAHTDPAQRLLRSVGRIPNSPAVAYGLVAFVGGVGSLFSWAFGLVAGALVARQVAVEARDRGLRLHYPLLVASAYAGFVIWHMGYSSSAALFVATPGHALEEQVGGTIPVTETIFAPWNMIIAVITLITIIVLCAAMRPKGDDEIIELPDDVRAEADNDGGSGGGGGDTAVATKVETEQRTTLAEQLDSARWITLALGAAIMAYLAWWFATEGLNLTLNIVNWSFLGLGLLLARSPIHYVELVADASTTVGQIIIQYPLYAGIMGMMIDTGLVSVIADFFTGISTAGTLGFWAFLSGGIVNFFVPSGGGQWAVQGPIFIEAAANLGTDPSRIVMGVAYGDQWSNMVQPFWTIPLLAIAGLHMRQIMGYTFVIFFATFFLFGGGILLAGAGN
ncbi:MAG: TIGR00366 family protein [Actinobacteria bacterium]|nr:TIGR00366 family protein [Actinomycetota bacterium]